MRSLSLVAMLLAMACNKADPTASGPQSTAETKTSAPLTTSPAGLAKAVTVSSRSDALDFSYSWPAQAAAIPALNRRFRADMEKTRAEALRNARGDMASARQDRRPFHSHEFSRSWTAAGDSGQLLSLESKTSFFTGGAHPNSGVDSLLWDRQANREIGVADMFDPPTRFAELVSFAYCQALDAERLKRREGAKLDGEFDQCPNLSDLALVPTDADADHRFESIRFIASPYVAGPYVEGEYDVPLPVTSPLIAAMKPEYRASFEAQRQ